jgi:hypothetical protein
MDEVDAHGNAVTDDVLLMFFNGHFEPMPFQFPQRARGLGYAELVLDTADPNIVSKRYELSQPYPLQGRSLAVLVLRGL